MKWGTLLKGLIILIVVFCSFSAHADFINVISQNYSIQASAKFYFDQTDNYYYQETSNIPISLHEDIGHTYVDVSSGNIVSAGYVQMHASASGDVGALSALVHCFANSSDEGDAIAYASSSASITFAPLVNKMILTTEIETYASIYLFDLTSNQTLYLLHNENEGMEAASSIIDFNLSHIYSINIETDMINFWSTEGFLSIKPVPEPATMLLLSLGLVGLVGIRRKIKN